VDMQQTRDLMTYIDPENGNLLADEVFPSSLHTRLWVLLVIQLLVLGVALCMSLFMLFLSGHRLNVRGVITCRGTYKRSYTNAT
jgi:hypothetical protein